MVNWRTRLDTRFTSRAVFGMIFDASSRSWLDIVKLTLDPAERRWHREVESGEGTPICQAILAWKPKITERFNRRKQREKRVGGQFARPLSVDRELSTDNGPSFVSFPPSFPLLPSVQIFFVYFCSA